MSLFFYFYSCIRDIVLYTVIIGNIIKERKMVMQFNEVMNNVEYGAVDDLFEKKFNDSQMIVVYPSSDDLLEFRGAICEEFNGYDEMINVLLDNNGLITNECEDSCCPYFSARADNAPYYIKCNMEGTKEGFFIVETNIIDVEYFTIIEDGHKYGTGIVFPITSLKGK